MSTKILNKYIELCVEFNKEPSLEGLRYFKRALKS